MLFRSRDFEVKRVANTNPSKSLTDYTGRYSDSLYGEVEVTLVGNKLFVNANNFLKATLSHWHYDTFRGEYEKDWYGKANASFSLNVTGKVEKLNFEGMGFRKVN